MMARRAPSSRCHAASGSIVAMDLLGIDPIDGGRTGFELTAPLVRFDGQLFGGTGLAVVVEVMEQATGRAAVWATVQFVGTASEGERIDVVVEELAHGGTTSQLRVTGTCGGRVVIVGLGSTAHSRHGGFSASFGTMPQVASPGDCGPLTFGGLEVPEEMKTRGPFGLGDFRAAPGLHDSQYVWARLDHVRVTRSYLAYIADFVPSAVVRAVGLVGGGTSLDNSMRFGPPPPEDVEWVLLDSDPYFGDNGFVHGAARLWTRDGRLVAVASQSAIARIFEAPPDPVTA